MLLALDVGNSNIFAGVFDGGELLLKFRRTSRAETTSDEIGVFLKAALRENKIPDEAVTAVAICSVVPQLLYSLHSACVKYFRLEPFLLEPGVKTGLNIKYKNPAEVGADRIANAVGALHLYPGSHLVIADYGTATTFCAVSKEKDYLGGMIMPGLKISMEALAGRTAQLRTVEIARPSALVGRSTVESIQSGLFHSNLAAAKEIHSRIRRDYFNGEKTLLIGTGGFSRLFEGEGVFDAIVPDLVLIGLRLAHKLNSKS
ncbi:MAG: type III pantothenate kinase [Elusimicrobiales bacterium]|nr:type III pantothenate kinase [Elusimicrobiales bacterium]